MRLDSLHAVLDACYRQILPARFVATIHANHGSPVNSPIQLQPDQSFTVPADRCLNIGGDSRHVAQVFQAGITGILASVSVDVESVFDAPLHVMIQDVSQGCPSGTILGERLLWSATHQPLSSAPLTLHISFDKDIYVRAGTQYAIVLDYGDDERTNQPLGYWLGASTDPGEAPSVFHTAHPGFRGWQPAGRGDLRLRFRTFVLRAEPVSDVGMAWLSRDRHTCVREIFTDSYRVENTGDKPLLDVVLSLGDASQFDCVEIDGVPGACSAPFSLDPGESRVLTVSIEISSSAAGGCSLPRRLGCTPLHVVGLAAGASGPVVDTEQPAPWLVFKRQAPGTQDAPQPF